VDTGLPRIAVLIPVHNGQADLDRTLASVDAQSGAFDVFVVDDGSEPAIKVDQSRYRHRVILKRLAKNKGIEAALNEGVREILQSGYEFIARQDAGDLDVDGRLERQVAYLDANPEVALIGTWARFVDMDGRNLFVFHAPPDPASIRRRLHYGTAFIHPTVMIRTSVLEKPEPYRYSFPLAEDYEFFFRVARRHPCANLQEVLVLKEENPASTTPSYRRRSLLSRMRIQLKYFDWLSPHSYLGLFYSTALLAIPYNVLIRAKKALHAVPWRASVGSFVCFLGVSEDLSATPHGKMRPTSGQVERVLGGVIGDFRSGPNLGIRGIEDFLIGGILHSQDSVADVAASVESNDDTHLLVGYPKIQK
jgi:glycosyltransferase involved in cell wall biosynthesis